MNHHISFYIQSVMIWLSWSIWKKNLALLKYVVERGAFKFFFPIAVFLILHQNSIIEKSCTYAWFYNTEHWLFEKYWFPEICKFSKYWQTSLLKIKFATVTHILIRKIFKNWKAVRLTDKDTSFPNFNICLKYWIIGNNTIIFLSLK